MFRSRDRTNERLDRLEEQLRAHAEALEGVRRVLENVQTAPLPAYDDRPLRDEIARNREMIEHQRLAIAEGIERVDRAERRVQQTVRRAREKLREHGLEDAGLEAEHGQLRFLDGARSGDEAVQPMHGPVAPTPPPDLSSLPGQWGPEQVNAVMKAKGWS